MDYKDEWLLLEADDDIDEMEHREPTEEFLFYRAVASGDVEQVKKNCEQGRFVEEEGVGVLSKDPVINLKYHFVITTAMITRLCRQNGMELEQAFRLSDFYIQKLDDISTKEQVQKLHDEMVMDYTEKMRNISAAILIPDILMSAKSIYIPILRSGSPLKIWLMSWGFLPAIFPGCLKKRLENPSAHIYENKKLKWQRTC